MKVIPLNLTARRKEVLWHAAYSTAEWSANLFRSAGRLPIELVFLNDVDVSEIVRVLRRERLIRTQFVEVSQFRIEVNITITPLGMDVLLGNVACVDPKGVMLANARKMGSEIGLIERGMW